MVMLSLLLGHIRRTTNPRANAVIAAAAAAAALVHAKFHPTVTFGGGVDAADTDSSTVSASVSIQED